MAEKKAYPLRINADVLAAAQRWADDELRSLNAQIEYVLRDALRKAGRLRSPPDRLQIERTSTPVLIDADHRHFSCRVVWRKEKRIGVHFEA